MKIRIETIGSNSSGLGHLVRMNTLAQELRKTLHIDVSLMTTLGSYYDEDIVLVDVDREDLAKHKVRRIRRDLPTAKVVVFKNDDTWDDKMDVDLTIRPDFSNVILEEVFREFEDINVGEEIKTILVTQGGSDPWGVSSRVLHTLEYLSVGATVFTVMGVATHPLTLQRVLYFSERSLLRGFIFHNLSIEDMADVICSTDLAITAPGQTYAELTAMSVPCIIIGHHERHEKIGKELQDKGAAVYLGIGPKMTDAKLVESVKNTLKVISPYKKRQSLMEGARNVVNKNGIYKVIEQILGVI